MARSFTSKIAGLEGQDYWSRLESLGMFSQERRRERNIIIFIWKLSRGLVEGYDLQFQENMRRGLLVVIPPMASPAVSAIVRAAFESSLKVKGGRLFNLIPKDLRDNRNTSLAAFKTGLDDWLKTVPDQPTVPGRQRAACTNSLIDQVAAMPPV